MIAKNPPQQSLWLFRKLNIAHAELMLHNDGLRKVTSEFELGYLTLDEQASIIEINLAGAVLMEVPRSNLIGKCLYSFMRPSSRPVFLAFLEKTLARSATSSCEVMILKNAGAFWAGFKPVLRRIAENRPGSRQFSFADITARKLFIQLSPRELEVLKWIASGKANKQMALEMGISIRTIEKHRSRLMEKLHIHDIAGLTRYALESGMTITSARSSI